MPWHGRSCSFPCEGSQPSTPYTVCPIAPRTGRQLYPQLTHRLHCAAHCTRARVRRPLAQLAARCMQAAASLVLRGRYAAHARRRDASTPRRAKTLVVSCSGDVDRPTTPDARPPWPPTFPRPDQRTAPGHQRARRDSRKPNGRRRRRYGGGARILDASRRNGPAPGGRGRGRAAGQQPR